MKANIFVTCWGEFTPPLEDVPRIAHLPLWRLDCDRHCSERGGGRDLVVPELCSKDAEQVKLHFIDPVLQKGQGTLNGHNSGGFDVVWLS